MNSRSKAGKSVLFFNFALRDGHFMARPVFNPQQSLIGEIIQSLERFNPRFAWIQFLFAQRDYNHLLMYTKAELENYVQLANTAEYDERSRQKIPRKEINAQWYKLAAARIKKIEQMLPKPTVIFAINGMWVANGSNAAKSAYQLQELPFSLCSDETDRLRAFLYRDPRIIRMLVDRRMVTDISPSIYRYNRSRDEPPSLILSPDEIPYYIHMPTGASAKGLSSIRPAAHFPVGGTLKAREVTPLEGIDTFETSKTDDCAQSSIPEKATVKATRIRQLEQPQQETENESGDDQIDRTRRGPSVAALKKIPTLEQPLEEDEAQRLAQIVSRNIRTFEILYDSEGVLDERFNTKAVTKVLLSSSSETALDDLENVYIPSLESVYGKLDYEILSDKRPKFVVEDLPRIVKL
jgi:hypothetical protein